MSYVSLTQTCPRRIRSISYGGFCSRCLPHRIPEVILSKVVMSLPHRLLISIKRIFTKLFAFLRTRNLFPVLRYFKISICQMLFSAIIYVRYFWVQETLNRLKQNHQGNLVNMIRNPI